MGTPAAFVLADDAMGANRALEHLSAADQLTGGVLGSRFQPQREAWLEHAARTPAPA